MGMKLVKGQELNLRLEKDSPGLNPKKLRTKAQSPGAEPIFDQQIPKDQPRRDFNQYQSQNIPQHHQLNSGHFPSPEGQIDLGRDLDNSSVKI